VAIERFFATDIYRASLAALPAFAELNDDLAEACAMMAEDDAGGQAWSLDKGYDGYTSYGSVNDLERRATCFSELAAHLKRHAAAFAKALAFDLQGRRILLDSYWVNILRPGGAHSGHVHPHAILSGTYYVRTPRGSGALRFEDPRLAMMMAAPTPVEDAPEDRQRFVFIQPAAGDLVLWESWLRHEVMPNRARSRRISISFNFRWA
jgi:uncharacterized protein (TIGR02466 family)